MLRASSNWSKSWLVDRNAVRRALRGSVYPVIPAFDSSGALDIPATESYLEYLVDHGARVLMVTAGTSRLHLLTHQETMLLNAAVANVGRHRAFTIAANPGHGGLTATLELCEAAHEAGADSVLVSYPERYYGDAEVVEYFRAIGRDSALPVLIHALPMRLASTGPGCVHPFDRNLLQALVEVPSVVGVKEESGCAGLRQELLHCLADRLVFVLAGGGMRGALGSVPFGGQTYLAGVGNIFPELEEHFFTHVMYGADPHRWIFEVEQPFFDVAVPIGWHTALKSAASIRGLLPPYERAPLRPPDDEGVAAMQRACEKLEAAVQALGGDRS